MESKEHINSQSTELNDSAWGESYQKNLPSFLPDQQNSEKPHISEKAVTEKMLEISSDRQDDLVDWINRIHSGQALPDDAYAEFNHYQEQNHLPNLTEEEWASSLESQLTRQETQDNYLIDTMQDLDSLNNTKSLEEILTTRAENTQKHIDALAQSGAWDKMTDAQRETLTSRRNSYENLADWTPHVRKLMQFENAEQSNLELDLEPKSEFESGPESESKPVETEQPVAEEAQPAAEPSQEKLLNVNSEAEIRFVIESLDHIQPDIRQLFAVVRGSFDAEKATAHLLTSNQQMLELSNAYLSVLQNGQNIGEIQQFANGYDAQSAEKYAQSLNNINSLRQKAAILPVSLKGQIIHYCQNVENTLNQIFNTIKAKDDKPHNTPIEKQKADAKETTELFQEGYR